ncbi:MAG: serine/threonine protein kinase [Gemmatimonadota bacterium]|nr:serine/threonine protein kinase [Gemmatimonadota bacterium]
MPETYVEKPGRPSGGAGPVTLPSELVERAASRLSTAATIYGVGYVFAYVPWMLLAPPAHAWDGLPLAIGAVVGSLLLAVWVRRTSLDPHTVMHLGLVYEVAGAIGIEHGLLYWWQGAAVVPNGISWTTVWIVIFPLIVPAPPRKALVAALAAASVRPVFFGILAARGVEIPALGALIQFSLPNYVCVGIAWAAGTIVIGWGHEVAKARRMGSYQLVERLGEGGMGEVWRAEHRMLARPAAIKLIHPESLGSSPGERATLVKRFEREAKATAALSSPHTVQLFDFGVTEDGTFYYVMELLRGLDLDVLVQRFGPMPAPRAAHLLRQACASLAEAHAQGLVHRDIKPGNLFLCRVGHEHDFVKVLDFGLVKRVEAKDPTLTAQNVATGTPAFMAPEIALGEPRIDARADIYALGCLGYWLVTGANVFRASSPMRVMLAHAHETPDPPSRRSEVGIPGPFEAIVMRCLAKNPADRFATADDLMAALEVAAGEDRWTSHDAKRWWRTHLPDLAA